MNDPIEMQKAKIKILETFMEVFKCKSSHIIIESESIDFFLIRVAIPECNYLRFLVKGISITDGNPSGYICIDEFTKEVKFIDDGNFSTSLNIILKTQLRRYFEFYICQYNLLSYIKNTTLL